MGVRNTDAARGLKPESSPDGAKKGLDASGDRLNVEQAKTGLGPATEPAASALALASAALALALEAWAQVEGAWAVAGRPLQPGGGTVTDELTSPSESQTEPSGIGHLRQADGPTQIAHHTTARVSAAPTQSAHARPLNGISEIRTFFRTNEQPIYFFGPTAFNLLGIDRWVRNFQYIVYYDSRRVPHRQDVPGLVA